MLRIEEIKNAIEQLPEVEFKELRRWFLEKDWKKWDKEIEKDSQNGKLDFLIEEALKEKKKGTLKSL